MVKVQEILQLSTEERISIIEMIWDSLDSEKGAELLTLEQQEEINRRIERHEKGEGKTLTWGEIESRLKFR
ncbi:MAG: addiction module protein [Cytophagales bacterium]|jgi:putative addiction module component (TIGR02574 family)|nr:addiction module protein [Cytophagales bacterium]MCA6366675.1 addiction module protein [Cytophagales bacterium]MCA6372688.1 addiction module protein [Cytophagales bacterium]MCA6377544.1 addiction module protein [Cytophagales bacterium]MCA6384711.1 addiction module protein [Cytophagales bacterium]